VVGEELHCPAIQTVAFFEVEVERLLELDAIVFDGYLRGLREAAWQGDGRMARLGYIASTLLWCLLQGGWVPLLTDESQHARWEQVFGRPMEQVADHRVPLLTFALGLEEEARGLMEDQR